VIAERVALPGGEVEVVRPPDAEALITEESFEHEEFLPYWAELWSSAVALAHDVSLRALRGKHTLELGCGLGLPSMAAALAGGRVTATDWAPAAIALAIENFARNGVRVETLVCSWTEPGAIVERAPWDLVLASDVLYERRDVGPLLDLLPRLAAEVLLADPGRPALGEFLAAARERWHVEAAGTVHVLRVLSP
jgi:predicted nicotinamide N-methyase